MSGNNIQLLVTLDAEPDAEDLERLTRQLRDELSELDVQADFVTSGSAPVNTKAGDVIEWGKLLLTLVSGGAITALFGTLQSWLTRHERRSVTLEINGDKLQVTSISSVEQKQLIGAWMNRHRE